MSTREDPARPIEVDRIHLGCDTVRVAGFHHVDVRETDVVDTVHHCRDLEPFATDSATLIFSNAFFEHLRVEERPSLLRDAARVLSADGWLLFTGLPDFAAIARAYLDGAPGHVSPTFDLFEAYRYTHGAPEGRPDWWYAQLHKGLLDAPTMVTLLSAAGFASACVFNYCWGEEPNPTNMGVYASPTRSTVDRGQLLRQLDDLPVNARTSSIEIAATL